MRDVQLAIDTGVDGLDIVIGTSQHLREHSHGKDMAFIQEKAVEVIKYVKSKGLEARCKSAMHQPNLHHKPDTQQSPAKTLSDPTWVIS